MLREIDRPEFDRQVSLLCAAYNVPIGDRNEAYWTAFNQLSLIEFTRLVTHVIGPDGPDKLPTVPALWKLRKTLRSAHLPAGKPGTPEVLTALVQTAVARWPLTEWQLRTSWNWIAREPEGQACSLLGVIIPQDPEQPDRYPARRLMVADLTREPASS